jgi:hypothetical protein
MDQEKKRDEVGERYRVSEFVRGREGRRGTREKRLF